MLSNLFSLFQFWSKFVPLVEQELFTIPEHLSSPPVFSGVRVVRSLVFCVVFCIVVVRYLSFCHCLFWSLCCLFFFDLWILITLLVSSSSFYVNYLSPSELFLVSDWATHSQCVIFVSGLHTIVLFSVSCLMMGQW
jgi:hypothetical protein